MDLIARPSRPTLPTELVDVASLGGAVIVRGLTLSQRMRIARVDAENGLAMLDILSVSVLASDGEPVFSREDWDIWASLHIEDAVALAGIARRLSGLDMEEASRD
jgi:hypothetical protein